MEPFRSVIIFREEILKIVTNRNELFLTKICTKTVCVSKIMEVTAKDGYKGGKTILFYVL